VKNHKISKEDLEKVTTLQIINCNLYEEDLVPIVRLLTQLPNCQEVNIAGNRFSSSVCDEHMLRLLHDKRLKWVNIAGSGKRREDGLLCHAHPARSIQVHMDPGGLGACRQVEESLSGQRHRNIRDCC